MWALRGLPQGVLTTRWPRHTDQYASATRGPAVVLRDADSSGLTDLDVAGLCPTGAISLAGAGDITLDQGDCIQCGRCIARYPEIFGWDAGVHCAALSRAQLMVPPAESPAALAELSAGLRQRTRALQRSVHLRHVDAGSDGSEEWEILALLNPVYDIHRLGIFLTASPRHADILLVTGAGAHGMAEPVRETYEAMPYPKLVIAVGTDACSGGLVRRRPRSRSSRRFSSGSAGCPNPDAGQPPRVVPDEQPRRSPGGGPDTARRGSSR
jgi:Ni,Fe-hydrogenase III small subunit/ferredoxin